MSAYTVLLALTSCVNANSLIGSVSWLSVWSVLVDEGSDSELSDEVLDDWVLEVDVGDLDLGLLWDEIHSSFSFFLLLPVLRQYSNITAVTILSCSFLIIVTTITVHP